MSGDRGVKHVGGGVFVVDADFPIEAVLKRLGVKYHIEAAPQCEWVSEIGEVKPVELPNFAPLLNYSYETKR